MAAKRKHRQAALNRQYADLITNAKTLYNDMYLALRLGPGTPTFEELLNYAGTKSGLKKPTKQSIKALKKMQTELGILQQAYGKLNIKSEAFRAVSKMIEQEHRLKEASKKAAAKAKKKAEQAEKKRQAEEKRKDREAKRKQKEAERYTQNVNAVRTVFKAAKDINLDLGQRKHLNAKEENIYLNTSRFISEIESILASDNMEELKRLNENCKEFINRFGVPGIYNFYKEEYDKLCAEIFDRDPFNDDTALPFEILGDEEEQTTPNHWFDPEAGNDDPYANYNGLDDLDDRDDFELE